MNIIRTAIPEICVLEPRVFEDARGYFFESFNQRQFEEATGHAVTFVQDNQSRSVKGVIRGLHYQLAPRAQGKLVRAVSGEIYDVAVDLRRGSPTLGKWIGVVLSAENCRQLWIPAGFAHGFIALSETADVLYKATDYWDKDLERAIRWNDPQLKIEWPSGSDVILSEKDQQAETFAQADLFDD
ncbi:dTDP-4-dehydrorhamnose 3,5-epimerase [Bordetella sp. 15P40C-2]|uniref:dTDP-4-dehydrorhamnose 3,5-epimerase n=1 Tax=Bordetella sp. 15P40C-2 TaxID=2572246 RepID=UPI001320F024|nr:dTDP-4-dehydrorhamnose 3,5-epimerase [Bordetella sp. 15P40C-2]MVW73303.1 dTDP-4-dehydrorhamnose 3,5-epimerase [Bordetella sp. 15P40C-2]